MLYPSNYTLKYGTTFISWVQRKQIFYEKI